MTWTKTGTLPDKVVTDADVAGLIENGPLTNEALDVSTATLVDTDGSALEVALAAKIAVVAPTFGDLFKQPLPSKAPTSKVTVTCDAYSSNWDGLGPIYGDAALIPYVKFSGTPISSIYGTSVDESGQGAAKTLDVETIFTGKNCSFMQYWFGTADPNCFRVFVDDEEIDQSPLAVYGVAQWWLNLDFAVYGTYKIRITGGYFLAYMACDLGGSFHKPEPRKALGVISDSYFEPSYGIGSGYSPPIELALATGWDVWNGAQGGTGFINNPGSGFTKYGSPERLAAIEAMDIDALLVNGTINDHAYPVADVKAAMIQFYADVAEIKPGVPIVQVGIEPVTYPGIAAPPGLATLVTAQQEAVAASPNVVGYIDPYTIPWLTGSGDEGVTDGNGNQDYLIGVDGIHLSVRGSKHYARLIADRMAPMKASL